MKHQKSIKTEKLNKVDSLATAMKESVSAVFVDYGGMGVKLQQELKKSLKETGGTMLVAKNTLMKLAGQKAGLPEEALTDTVLSGQNAVILASDDSVAPIQVLGKFISTKEFPKWKAGVVDGVYQDKESIIKISKLPGKSELYAQTVGAVAAPLYSVVGTLQANLSKLVFILQAAKEAKGA